MRSNSNTHASARPIWAKASGLLITLVVLLAALWIEATPPQRAPPPAGQALRIDKSTPAQEQRKMVIDKLLSDGLLRRIESDTSGGGEVRASVRPGFYLLDEATRREYAHVIYAYYFDGSNMNDVV